MSTAVDHATPNIDPGAGQLPMRKRKKPDEEEDEASTTALATPMVDLGPDTKVQKVDKESETTGAATKKAPMSKGREIRLDQNRKAARESRRRKKVMIEELQRSVIFFSRANGTLKEQNDQLSRLFMQAQVQVSAFLNQKQGAAVAAQMGQQVQTNLLKAGGEQQQPQQQQGNFQQAQANAVASQAMYESQGFPAAAARAAAQTMNAGPNTTPAPAAPGQQTLPPMQPGATMQAMANFQQAAAAAMQAAVQGMQGVPGFSLGSIAAAPPGTNPQQAYNDTMTALAMQQAAAAAAAGQQFFQNNPFLANPMMMWSNQQPAAAPGVVQPPPAVQPQAIPQHGAVPQQPQMAPAPVQPST